MYVYVHVYTTIPTYFVEDSQVDIGDCQEGLDHLKIGQFHSQMQGSVELLTCTYVTRRLYSTYTVHVKHELLYLYTLCIMHVCKTYGRQLDDYS